VAMCAAILKRYRRSSQRPVNDYPFVDYGSRKQGRPTTSAHAIAYYAFPTTRTLLYEPSISMVLRQRRAVHRTPAMTLA